MEYIAGGISGKRESMNATEILIGLIMMATIGPAVGNYATSVVYRLPLAQTPFEKHPYCGTCGTMLSAKDLFPIWSYVWLGGRCRYCGTRIPPVHTAVEIACGLLFIVNFLIFDISETFILVTALGVFWVIMAALEYSQKRFYPLIITFCFFLAAMQRLLTDGSIYPMIQSGFILLFVAVAIWRLFTARAPHSPERTNYYLPKWAIMAALSGIALPLTLAVFAMIIAGTIYGLQRAVTDRRMVSPAVGIGVWAMLLYSQVSTNL